MELIFRAWNNEKSEMSYNVYFDDYYIWDNEADRESLCGNCFDIDDGIIMQYTGYKDKNEVEIYEGDIVKTPEGIFEVAYYNSAFALRNKKGHYEYMCNICSMMGKVYEVIGNKFENPELLKGK